MPVFKVKVEQQILLTRTLDLFIAAESEEEAFIHQRDILPTPSDECPWNEISREIQYEKVFVEKDERL